MLEANHSMRSESQTMNFKKRKIPTHKRFPLMGNRMIKLDDISDAEWFKVEDHRKNCRKRG